MGKGAADTGEKGRVGKYKSIKGKREESEDFRSLYCLVGRVSVLGT